MLLSAVSVLVVAQSSSEIPEGLMTNPVQFREFYLNFDRASHRFSKKVQMGKMLCQERNEEPPCTS